MNTHEINIFHEQSIGYNLSAHNFLTSLFYNTYYYICYFIKNITIYN